MRLLLCAALVAGMTAAAGAEEPQIDGVEILNYGVYKDEIVGRRPLPGTAIGHQLITRSNLLQRDTDTICARLDLSFGVEFRVLGKPAGQDVMLDMVTRFPDQGVVNAQGVRFHRNEFASRGTIGNSDVRTYGFEEPWELVAGTWVLEFHYQGRKLAEKAFTIMTSCPSA